MTLRFAVFLPFQEPGDRRKTGFHRLGKGCLRAGDDEFSQGREGIELLRRDRLRSGWWWIGGLALFACAILRPALAVEFAETFEGNETSWTVDATDGVVQRHLRSDQAPAKEGARTEIISLVTARDGGTARLSHPLRPARVIPELTVSLWLRANRPGTTVWLRVIFPHVRDPETGNALYALVPGESYTTPGKWQNIRCVTTDKQIQEQIVLQRARLKDVAINHHDLYVDRVFLDVPLGVGETDLLIDDLHFGPIVDLRPETEVAQVDQGATEQLPRIEVRGGRLEIDGYPFFPRIIPIHDESPDLLQSTGANVLFVPDYEDVALLAEIRRRGMWGMAEPPCVISETGKVLDAKSAGIVPFSERTSPILMWYIGTLIPAEMRPKVAAWTEQVHHADRMIRRPVAADVAELEQVYSRNVDLLSSSRHILNTTFSFKDYRDWLVQKRQLANPWTYHWTWIQTEPVGANSRWREEHGKLPVVIEPEQIRLQVYSALSAGCRAIAYWKRSSLDSEEPGALERRLTIQMLNLELELLEPWLATGVVSETVPFTVPVPVDPTIKRATVEARHRKLGIRGIRESAVDHQNELDRIEQTNNELEAAIIKSPNQLVTMALMVWYGNDAQFVPGQMAAYNTSIVVPGVEPSAHAWVITPTSIGSVEKSERVPGGKKIELKKFDQTAIVVLSSSPDLRQMLEAKIREIAPAYARTALDLAKAKFERVAATHAELKELGSDPQRPDGDGLLRQARREIENAEVYLERSDYDLCRQESADAMQILRIIQRSHWDYAMFKMSDGTSSPYTVSFNTLPDHWRMIARLGRSEADPSDNLIPSGDFEDEEVVVTDWHHSQNPVEGVRAAAELYPVAHEGRYSLRLVAVPETGIDIPKVVGKSPVTVATPPVQVTEGQLLHIGGWVRVATPVSGSLDGVMLYDNFTGSVGALRWRNGTDWQWFDMVREVHESGDFSLLLSMQGLGEVQFDDLRIVPIDPPTGARQASGTKESGTTRPDLLRLLNPWPFRRARPDEAETQTK